MNDKQKVIKNTIYVFYSIRIVIKKALLILLLLFPICIIAQKEGVNLNKQQTSKAMKPWMKRYLHPSYNPLTVNLPFRKTSPVITKYAYARLEKRNQLEREKLSPYLKKVYLQKQHALLEDIYSAPSTNLQNSYDPRVNLTNRVFRFLGSIKK